MEELLFGLIAAITLWRIVLCTGLGALCAWLVYLLGITSAALPFLLVFLGASVGVVWHAATFTSSAVKAQAVSGSHRQRLRSAPTSAVSPVIAFGGIALIGGLWGALIESEFGMITAVASIVLLPLALAPIFASLSGQPIAGGWVLATIVASLVGLASPHIIESVFEHMASNHSIERTSNSWPRYSTTSLLLPRGQLLAAAHVKR